MTALWRLRIGGGVRLARGDAETGPAELLEEASLDALLAELGGLERAMSQGVAPIPKDARVLPPVEGQEVWAAGVTYLRSREARKEESDVPDHYDRAYEADRPELFFKSVPGRVRGAGDRIGIRADSTWDVPEPELGVVADAGGTIVGYMIGDDVSSRSIEGENPLYLPQAKSFTGSCALGPCLVPVAAAPALVDMVASLRVDRARATVFEGSVRISEMKRSLEELVDWLFRAQEFPVGVVLLTGTGVVPSPAFTLHAGDEVAISITGLGELRNVVETVGR